MTDTAGQDRADLVAMHESAAQLVLDLGEALEAARTIRDRCTAALGPRGLRADDLEAMAKARATIERVLPVTARRSVRQTIGTVEAGARVVGMTIKN